MTTEEKRKEYLKGCEIFGVDEKGLGGFDHEADECHTCEMKTPDMHGACKVESDEELAGLKAALEGVNITFDKETNVALTTRQKELLNGVNIKTRSQVNVTLERLEMLDAATTFTEWKEGSLNAEAIQ